MRIQDGAHGNHLVGSDGRFSTTDVVILRVYVVDATTDRFEEAWAPTRDMLWDATPSMTGIDVQALWTPAVRLEVEMIARLPSGA